MPRESGPGAMLFARHEDKLPPLLQILRWRYKWDDNLWYCMTHDIVWYVIWQHDIWYNNYSPKWRWIALDIPRLRESIKSREKHYSLVSYILGYDMIYDIWYDMTWYDIWYDDVWQWAIQDTRPFPLTAPRFVSTFLKIWRLSITVDVCLWNGSMVTSLFLFLLIVADSHTSACNTSAYGPTNVSTDAKQNRSG